MAMQALMKSFCIDKISYLGGCYYANYGIKVNLQKPVHSMCVVFSNQKNQGFIELLITAWKKIIITV